MKKKKKKRRKKNFKQIEKMHKQKTFLATIINDYSKKISIHLQSFILTFEKIRIKTE